MAIPEVSRVAGYTLPRSSELGEERTLNEQLQRVAFAALRFGVVLATLLLVLHLFRFVPVGRQGIVAVVWDRWLHRTCLAPAMRPLDCTEASAVNADNPQISSDEISLVEKARRAGFSELEILNDIESELAKSRKEGRSDETFAKEYFAPRRHDGESER
jgi:hypothetical protein